MFAIAITLLVIEIGVPHLENEPEGTNLFGALVGQWPSYLGYVISFLVIGPVWANHHNRFTYIVRSDHVSLFLNTVFLMCVAFSLFPTALLAEYVQSEERTTAIAVYAGTPAVTAVFFTLLWLYAANGYRLVDCNLDPTALRAMTRRYVAGMVLYLIALRSRSSTSCSASPSLTASPCSSSFPSPGVGPETPKLPLKPIELPRSRAGVRPKSSFRPGSPKLTDEVRALVKTLHVRGDEPSAVLQVLEGHRLVG